MHRNKSISHIVLLIQGLYLLVTGIWPVIHIDSFMAVTGPKTDIWLVKTVGLMTIAAAFAIIRLSRKDAGFTIGIPVALVFALIDFKYAVSGVISKVYLLDGFMQVLFIALLCLSKARK